MNLIDICKQTGSKFLKISKNKIIPYVVAPIIAFTPFINGCGGGSGDEGGNGNGTKQEEIIKTGTTNSNGQAYFTDNQTLEKVILEVVDKDDKSQIPNMNITYWDGDGYEIFLVDDPSNKYMPSIGLYPHNSNHLIETGKISGGIYEIYTIDEGDSINQVIYKWKQENGLESNLYNYSKTINYDEYIEIQKKDSAIAEFILKGINLFLQIPLPTDVKSISDFVDEHIWPIENPPQRYDIYTDGSGLISKKFITIIPSNIPTVNIDTPNIYNTEVDIFWEGADKDTYEGILGSSTPDLTKYLDGNNTSDLTYSWKITKNKSVYNNFNWTAYNINTSTTINLPDCGTYSLELRVKDEVNNIGHTAIDFEISDACYNSNCTDNDSDGYYAESECGTKIDCNDNNYYVNPGREEICEDRIDNNCNGIINEGCNPSQYTNSLGMTFNLIPAGTFTMGSPKSEIGRYDQETQHQVTLTQQFYIQTTEVTQRQWKTVKNNNPSYFQNCGDNCPVENVSWYDVQDFITDLNNMGQGTYRLPTEAEWEYSARAGTTTALPNGNITMVDKWYCLNDPIIDLIGWYCGNSDYKTHPVAQKTSNNWGLYDMHGNVSEECQDWFDGYDYQPYPVTNPIGPSDNWLKVNRGGNYSDAPRFTRSANREADGITIHHSGLGFRLVKTAK